MGNALCKENSNKYFPNGGKEKVPICGSNNAAESNKNLLKHHFWYKKAE